MSFTMWTLGIPLCIGALGVLLMLVLHPNLEPGYGLVVVAFLWLLFTGKARKTYWNARIRSRASYDARRARSRAS